MKRIKKQKWNSTLSDPQFCIGLSSDPFMYSWRTSATLASDSSHPKTVITTKPIPIKGRNECQNWAWPGRVDRGQAHLGFLTTAPTWVQVDPRWQGGSSFSKLGNNTKPTTKPSGSWFGIRLGPEPNPKPKPGPYLSALMDSTEQKSSNRICSTYLQCADIGNSNSL